MTNFLSNQEKIQLQKVLATSSQLRTPEERTNFLTFCGLESYGNSIQISDSSDKFIISIYNQLSRDYVNNGEKLALVVFLEYIIEVDSSLSQDDKNFIQYVINKLSKNSVINPESSGNMVSPNSKSNKLSLLLKSCLGLGVLIISSLIGYQNISQPKIICDDTQLHNPADSIKIVITKFDKNQKGSLENSLGDKLSKKINNVVICYTQETVKDSTEAKIIGAKVFPKNSNSGLVIWGSLDELVLTGGVTLMNELKNTENLHLQLKNKYEILDAQIIYLLASYGVSLIYFDQDKPILSQRNLQQALDDIKVCHDGQSLLNQNQENISIYKNRETIADLYFNLGLIYRNTKHLERALIVHKCAFNINSNRYDARLQQAEIYQKLPVPDNTNALLSYSDVIENAPISLKTDALISRSAFYANNNMCLKAERDLTEVVNDLDNLYGLEQRAEIRFFECNNPDGAVEDLYQFCRIKPDGCNQKLKTFSEFINSYNQQQRSSYIAQLRKLSQSQTKYQLIINKIIN